MQHSPEVYWLLFQTKNYRRWKIVYTSRLKRAKSDTEHCLVRALVLSVDEALVAKIFGYSMGNLDDSRAWIKEIYTNRAWRLGLPPYQAHLVWKNSASRFFRSKILRHWWKTLR